MEECIDTVLVNRMGADQMNLEWDNSYLGKSYTKKISGAQDQIRNYAKYTDVVAGIDYLVSYNTDVSTYAEITAASAGSIVFNTTSKKTVLLTADNIGDGTDDNDYLGRVYPFCSFETRKLAYFEVDSLSESVVKGMAVTEIPVNASTGIRKIFNPGMTIHVIEETKEIVDATVITKYRIYLNNEKMTMRGVLADVDDYKKLFSDPTIHEYDDDSFLNHENYKGFRIAIGNPYVIHQKGNNVLDAAGLPKPSKARTYEYYVNAIQLDARAYLGSEVDVNTLRKSITDMVNTYAVVVDTYRPELLENTHLYYQPKRSIGNANFSVGNDVVKALPLQLATEFTLTVKSFVYEDDNLRELISNKILEYVTAQIEESVLSSTAISKLIMENLKEYVDAVAVSGFNTKEDLSGALTTEEKFNAYQTQVLKVVDTDAKCSIRRMVYVDDRKLLATKRGLTINFVV